MWGPGARPLRREQRRISDITMAFFKNRIVPVWIRMVETSRLPGNLSSIASLAVFAMSGQPRGAPHALKSPPRKLVAERLGDQGCARLRRAPRISPYRSMPHQQPRPPDIEAPRCRLILSFKPINVGSYPGCSISPLSGRNVCSGYTFGFPYGRWRPGERNFAHLARERAVDSRTRPASRRPQKSATNSRYPAFPELCENVMARRARGSHPP